MSRRTTSVRPVERGRVKISTTVAPETHAFLEQLVTDGQAATLADALDLVVGRQIERERRATVEQQIAAYYDGLSDEDLDDQRVWAAFAEREMLGPDAS